jgi:high-affinity nickel-transport protein
VSTLVTGERSSAKAAWLGACWGLGHTLTLLAAGAVLVVWRAEMPGRAAEAFELGVILLLVGFGIRAIHHGVYRGPNGPTHSHAAPDQVRPAGYGGWTFARPLLVGAVHGLAGSGALVALVVTTLPSTTTRLSYLALFGAGTTVGMAVLSGLVGWPLARIAAHPWAVRTLSIGVGSVSVILGLVWSAPLLARWF